VAGLHRNRWLFYSGITGRFEPEYARRRAKDLLYMLQEEKVARDVYKKMAEKYNVRIFQNISISEQRHMDAVRSKIDKYSIPLLDILMILENSWTLHLSNYI